MLLVLRPLLRPLPLLGISTGGIFLAASLSSRAAPPAKADMTQNWPIKHYQPRHKSWPYQPLDFVRQDESPDPGFYSSPRLVTHIDDAAIASLKTYYDSTLPEKGRILDFCSSWISHYPMRIEHAVDRKDVEVVGMGMNKKELDANALLTGGRLLVDLNKDPDVAGPVRDIIKTSDANGSALLDASTCVVSIDYLTNPVDVLKSLLAVTKPGGSVHLAISNRCFPTKAVGRWLRVSEPERLDMVGDYLWFAGWRNIEIVELSNGQSGESEGDQASLRGFMKMMGMSGRDPLWVVRAIKE